MANISNKFSQNAPGRFFVDNQCIDCDLCRQIAPGNFKRNFNGISGHSVVFRQPMSKNEERLCLDALESCPVQAIGAIDIPAYASAAWA